MNYGVSGSNPAESVALALNLVPIPAIDSFLPLIKTRSIMAGVRLGVFEALRDRDLNAEQIATTCGMGLSGVHFLLRTLTWAGYLTCNSDRFSLSALARKSMLKGSPNALVGFVTWNQAVWQMLARLEDCLTSGKGLEFHDHLNEREWADYQRAMMEGARFASKTVGRLVPVKAGARKMLDIGGSHGLLGASLCRRHPPMTSCVLDLPNAVEPAKELAREAGIDDIVEHRAGDLRTSSFGTDNDVVLMSNILHHLDPLEIPSVFTRVLESLSTDGTAAIWDVETPNAASKPAHGDAFGLFCWLTSTSGCFTGEQYADWLRQAGFRNVKIARPVAAPGQALITGRKNTR